MDKMDPVQKLKEKFGEVVVLVEEKSPERVYVTVKKEEVAALARYLSEDLQARFVIMSALDTRQGIEVLYHFSFDTLGKLVSLKTIAPMPLPELESISPVIRGAEYIEREIHDILGVNFKNHPNLGRFILGDDWPEGVYPYRKEHKGQCPYRTEEEQELFREQIRSKGEK
ncbi:MAG: NADH-quinone oxidoreductase subunit C [Chloroflexota bacterium]|nr:NADH-quinone oxidoreductase subunit C [Chloroflexota bacterium]